MITAVTNLEQQIMEHEGYEPVVYRCPAGKLTVGIGRNLESKGITMTEALYLLRNDIHDCIMDLIGLFDNWCHLSDNRKHALIGMRFNLGPAGFRTFKRMIAAVRAGEFTSAAHEMKDSKWYEQVGGRGKTLRNMMLGVGE